MSDSISKSPFLHPKSSHILITLFFSIFLDFLGFGIMLPNIPQLFTNPQSPNYLFNPQDSEKIGYIFAALFIGIFSVSQFFAGPILGNASDRYGRKPILFLSFVGTCVSNILLGISLYYKLIVLMIISRIIQGVTSGSLAVAYASIADITPIQYRARNFGILGAAFGLGLICGPLIGGMLTNPQLLPFLNISSPFFFNAGLSLFNVILILLVFPETLNIKKKVAINALESLLNIVKAFSYKTHRTIFIYVLLLQIGYNFYNIFITVYLSTRFHFSPQNISYFYIYLGFYLIFAQLILLRLFTRWGMKDYWAIGIFSFTLSFGLFAYTLANHWWLVLVIAPIVHVSMTLLSSYSSSFVSRRASDEIQGSILGVNSSMLSFGQAIPGIIAGFIIANTNYIISFYLASVLICIAGIVFAILFTKQKNTKLTDHGVVVIHKKKEKAKK